MNGLTRKLIRPTIALALLVGSTAGMALSHSEVAGATTGPSIRFVSESFVNGAWQERVTGTGFTPGQRVWIGIAVDGYNSQTHKSQWNYLWGAQVTASQMGINTAGGVVSTTIAVPLSGPYCREIIGLAASDLTTGASTPPAPASQYPGGFIPAAQVNNVSQVSRNCTGNY